MQVAGGVSWCRLHLLLSLPKQRAVLDLSHSDGKQRRQTFEARLAAAQEKQTPRPHVAAAGAFAQGTRHAVEIAVTTVVGAGLGVLVDRWLGSRPWGLLLFLLLGVAAGIWNLVKAVSLEAEKAKSRAVGESSDESGESSNLNDQEQR